MHSLAEIYSSQYKGSNNHPKQKQEQPKTAQVNVVLHMPEVAGLIRHLDLLYAKMLIGQQQETQTIGWYNHGDSRVREG
jgi:hypothetical protein